MMKVILNETVKDFLTKKEADSITLEVRGCSSWSGVVMKPIVSVGKPYELDNFTMIEVDGVNVYVMNGLRAQNDTVELSVEKFLFMENLVQKGMIV